MAVEWADPDRVADYLSREIPHRDTADAMLLQALPSTVERVLDLGTGDGRLLALVAASHPAARGVGIDMSDAMLDRARRRFAQNALIEVRSEDLGEPLSLSGPFDVVVSGLAIHHLEDDRKRALFRDVRELLRPGGVFANLDLVSSASPAQHERFRTEIGSDRDDPSDRLAGLCEQLDWLRTAGFEEVDCHFKWLELALFVARRSGMPDTAPAT